jgi:hypothetical protein
MVHNCGLVVGKVDNRVPALLHFSPKLTVFYELNEIDPGWLPSDSAERFLTARYAGNRASGRCSVHQLLLLVQIDCMECCGQSRPARLFGESAALTVYVMAIQQA